MKLGIKSFLIVGIIAVIFILMIKVIFNKFPVAGITPAVNAV